MMSHLSPIKTRIHEPALLRETLDELGFPCDTHERVLTNDEHDEGMVVELSVRLAEGEDRKSTRLNSSHYS